MLLRCADAAANYNPECEAVSTPAAMRTNTTRLECRSPPFVVVNMPDTGCSGFCANDRRLQPARALPTARLWVRSPFVMYWFSYHRQELLHMPRCHNAMCIHAHPTFPCAQTI